MSAITVVAWSKWALYSSGFSCYQRITWVNTLYYMYHLEFITSESPEKSLRLVKSIKNSTESGVTCYRPRKNYAETRQSVICAWVESDLWNTT